MYCTGLTVILLATVVSIGSCQEECSYPKKSDMETVIEHNLEYQMAPSVQVNIEISILHPVCLAVGNSRDTYRSVSIWVRYECSGNDICPDGVVEEQFESECDNGEWSHIVQNDAHNARTENPQASYATTTKRNCFRCLSPDKPSAFDSDPTTHCLSCDSACTNGGGVRGCTNSHSGGCCNFYHDSVCIQTCPANHIYENFTFVCGCPVGRTGDDCTIVVQCSNAELPIDNGYFVMSETTFNAVVTYHCYEGYTLDPSVGDAMRTCQADGTWSGSPPQCQVNKCGPLSNPDNGMVAISDPELVFGTTATYTCNTNYFPADAAVDQIRTCMTNREWSGAATTCTLGVCPEPPELVNGNRVSPVLKFTFNATYTCNIGYTLTGDAVLFCMDDGNGDSNGAWMGAPPSCVLNNCDPLTAPENGMVSTPGGTYQFDTVATYSCNTGYTMTSGDKERTCMANKAWSGDQPTCEIVDCGPAPAPLNGTVLVELTNETKYNSKANYTCDEGLIYKSGDLLLICEASGEWSGTQLICEMMPTPPTTPTTTGAQCVRQSLMIVVIFLLFSIFCFD